MILSSLLRVFSYQDLIDGVVLNYFNEFSKDQLIINPLLGGNSN